MGIILIFYQWCYLAAVERIGVVAATLIARCVPPAQVALLSALFLGETVFRTALIALGGALLGTVMPVGSPTVVADGGVMLAGVLFALGSAAGIAAHALDSHRIAGRHDALLPLTLAFDRDRRRRPNRAWVRVLARSADAGTGGGALT